MLRCSTILMLAGLIGVAAHAAHAPAAAPASKPAPGGKLPHIRVDVPHKQVRVECEPCFENMDVGLEFFCCQTGTNEYESVLRTDAKASQLHLALLMIGLEPGEPVHYDEKLRQWLPPKGPPLNITCEYLKDDKPMSVPAHRLMRNRATRKEMDPFTFIFSGSRIMQDGKYAADAVGYHVSVLNNELTVIDIPTRASRDLESRQWERNSDLLPLRQATVWMVIEPASREMMPRAGAAEGGPRSQALPTLQPADGEVVLNQGLKSSNPH